MPTQHVTRTAMRVPRHFTVEFANEILSMLKAGRGIERGKDFSIHTSEQFCWVKKDKDVKDVPLLAYLMDHDAVGKNNNNTTGTWRVHMPCMEYTLASWLQYVLRLVSYILPVGVERTREDIRNGPQKGGLYHFKWVERAAPQPPTKKVTPPCVHGFRKAKCVGCRSKRIAAAVAAAAGGAVAVAAAAAAAAAGGAVAIKKPCATCGKMFTVGVMEAHQRTHGKWAFKSKLEEAAYKALVGAGLTEAESTVTNSTLAPGEFMYNKRPFAVLRGMGGGILEADFLLRTHHGRLVWIETNGQQHYGPQQFGNQTAASAATNFAQQQVHDQRKRDFAVNAGIQLIEIKPEEIKQIPTIVTGALRGAQ
jgi:hypothetical protein